MSDNLNHKNKQSLESVDDLIQDISVRWLFLQLQQLPLTYSITGTEELCKKSKIRHTHRKKKTCKSN